jgi:phospholipase/carboxylesterase
MAGVAAACAGNSGRPSGAPRARLGARPRSVVPADTDLRPGIIGLGLDAQRDAFLRVPPATPRGRSLPLVLLLHGAGGRAERVMRAIGTHADREQCLVLAPDSRARTWDAVTGSFGPDIEFIDQALAVVFSRWAVDSRRVGVAGFSDGATYSLALARSNGDLFSRGIAFSPGFLLPIHPVQRPRLFVSHGTHDRVLAIDLTSRPLVAELRRNGYQVEYREFDGDHEIPPGVAADAMRWFAGPTA